MPFEDNIKQIAQNDAMICGSYTAKNISKSPFDKTYLGRVVDKETCKDSANNLTLISRWVIAANGKIYYVKAENSNITSAGQAVRLYIPNNNRNNAFAEVINPATAPNKIVYKENDKDYDEYKGYGVDNDRQIKESDVTVDTVVETWKLPDKTELKRVYALTIINSDKDNEEVTSIVCPDGRQIKLEGFMLG